MSIRLHTHDNDLEFCQKKISKTTYLWNFAENFRDYAETSKAVTETVENLPISLISVVIL